MNVTKTSFGNLKTGEKVYKYTLKNNFLEVSILNYGGIITDILMPDKEGVIENIVLNYSNIREYEEKNFYYGAIIGRVAGRIKNAQFLLNKKVYYLSKNDNENTLHGGIKGLNRVIWEVKQIKNGIELSYISHHMEEGFPGKVNFIVQYILNDQQLEISYKGIPDRDTILSLTNHSYFNLHGNSKGDILDHELYINSDKVFYLDDSFIPYETPVKTLDTIFDFKKIKEIKKNMLLNNEQNVNEIGYNHPFLLAETQEANVILKSKKSGRKLMVTTTEEVAVIYTGYYLENMPFKGICVETQEIPNRINFKTLKKNIYNNENIYNSKTIFKFII